MKSGPIILIIAGAAILALLYFAPLTPGEKTAEIGEEAATHSSGEHNPDQEVDEALRQLESGELPPMQAVLKIREIADAHPDNRKAQFTLGVMSMQTGQYEKAVERFEIVVNLYPKDADAHRLLAGALRQLGNTDEAADHLKKAYDYSDDEEVRTEIEKEMTELNINK